MPKAKSHSGAKKRFHVTGTGKVAHKSAYKRHLLSGKSIKRKRALAGWSEVFHSEQVHVRQMLNLRAPR